MVSERDRKIMRLRGEAMDALNHDAVAEAARRSPGENIEIGLKLGGFALAFDSRPPLDHSPSPPWWLGAGSTGGVDDRARGSRLAGPRPFSSRAVGNGPKPDGLAVETVQRK